MGLQQFILRNIKVINGYFPYLGAGISLKSYSPDFKRMEVQLKEKWYNRNLFGTHFGGSLYSMCDPFFVFMIMQNIGQDYIVWDKAAAIEFKKPGKGTVTAVFEISDSDFYNIKSVVALEGKGNFDFATQILNKENEVVAIVKKVIYVRKK